MCKLTLYRSAGPLLLAAAALAGCQTKGPRGYAPYETIHPDPARDTQRTRECNGRAVELLRKGQLEQAEKQLHSALSADLFSGPAHNNLGTVYYRQEKYYLAAWEFQYACKLMPKKARPRNNLGMVFEAVGRLDDAAKWYEEALALDPEAVEVAGNLARVYVRTNRDDEKTRQLLQEVVMKDERPGWVQWARQRLALMGSPRRPATTQPAPVPAVTEDR